MLRYSVVFLVIVLAADGIDNRIFRRYHGSTVKVDCFDYPEPKDLKYFRNLDVHRPKKPRYLHYPKYRPTAPTRNALRRSDYVITKDDIVKEHAKLVQDINSLRQVLYVPPLTDETKDYDDSVFHEILETSTTPRPTIQPTRKGIPIILMGGASQKVTSPPVKVTKTINLVGTSAPIVKHPYPFVTPTRSPVRICMATPISTKEPYITTRQPSLLERIINIIYPR